MAAGKQTPRQRMIGILYLVLLGLIALNVPDSLLDAFKNISDSLDASRGNVTTGIQNTFSAFEQTKLKEQPERARPYYLKAKEASRLAGELATYVESLRARLVKEGGGIDTTINDVKGRDDLDVSPRVMITEKNADNLRKKIEDTRDQLLALLDEKERAQVNFSLNTTDPKPRGLDKKNWQEANFGDGIPLGAALTSLAKIEADTKNAESEVVKRILGKVDQAVVNLDKFAAVAVAPTSYLIKGQPYTAEVFLTAYDSKLNPSITVGGSSIPVKDGKGTYTVNTSKEGFYTWQGIVRVKQTDGSIKTYTTPDQKYQVAVPSAVVSADKMRVMYANVPNPISVSAPGISRENLRVTMTNGSLSGSGASYTADVSNIGATATVTVSAVIEGKTQVLGSTDFKVKRIPDPTAKFGGKTSGPMPSVAIKAQDRIFAILENFDFDAKFTVQSFSMVVTRPKADPIIESTTGNMLSPKMLAAIRSITPGSSVIFYKIYGVGPDRSQRELNPIALTAN